MLSSLLFSVALAAQTPPTIPAPAQEPFVKFDQQIQAKPGEFFVVKADTNLVWKKWTIPPGLTIVPCEHTKYGENAHVCFGPVGAYKFKLEGTFHDKFASGETVVFVGQPGPVPPGPVPPVPVPPVPDNSLAGELQRLYDADTDQQKNVQRVRLVNLWTSAAEQMMINPGFTTVKQFCETMSAQSRLAPFFLQPDDLQALRRRLASDLIAATGGESTPLGNAATDDRGNPLTVSEVRMKGKAVLERYAAALASVK